MISVSETSDFIQLENAGKLFETVAGKKVSQKLDVSHPCHEDNCQQDKLWKMKI